MMDAMPCASAMGPRFRGGDDARRDDGFQPPGVYRCGLSCGRKHTSIIHGVRSDVTARIASRLTGA
jgi:hypothetical protein